MPKWYDDNEYLNITEQQRYEIYLKGKNIIIHKTDTECPLCGADFDDNDMFVCQDCGELLPKSERSPYEPTLCWDCDPDCHKDITFKEKANI